MIQNTLNHGSKPRVRHAESNEAPNQALVLNAKSRKSGAFTHHSRSVHWPARRIDGRMKAEHSEKFPELLLNFRKITFIQLPFSSERGKGYGI